MSVQVCGRVALGNQHATLVRLIVCGLLDPPHFSTLSHKRHDFREKVTEHKMCVLTFSTTFIRSTRISHCKKNSARYCHKHENVFMHSTRYSSRILMKIGFYRQIFEKAQMPSFIKIRPLRIELFHADRQADSRHVAYSRSSKFCENA